MRVVIYDLDIEVLGLCELARRMKALGLFELIRQINPASGDDGSAYILLGIRPER